MVSSRPVREALLPAAHALTQEAAVVDPPLPQAEMGAEIVEGPFGMDPEAMPPDCCRGCPPSTYAFAEGILFRRENEFLSTSSGYALDGFDYQPGGRVTYGRKADCLEAVEFSYMTVEPWVLTDQALSPAGLLQPRFGAAGGLGAGNISGFINAIQHDSFYKHEMHNIEIDRVHWGWDVIKTTVGFRYMILNEEFNFASIRGPNQFGTMALDLNNHIFGPQIGSEMFYDIGGKVSLSMRGKAGAFMNVNDGSGNFFNRGAVDTVLAAADQNIGFSAMGELGGNAYYHLNDRWKIRAGYELWYIYGVATVEEQLTGVVRPNFGRNIDDQGDIFYHGFTLGLEWRR